VGLAAGDFYVGGNERGRVLVVPGRKNKAAWVLGESVGTPLSPPERFKVGLMSMALSRSVLPFVIRGPQKTLDVIHALSLAAESPLPGAQDRADLEELGRTLAKKLPRKARKSLTELFLQIKSSGTDPATWAEGIQRSAVRTGLVVGGQLRIALVHVLGGTITPESVGGNEEAMALVRFWVSEAAQQARKELGFAL